MKLKQVGKSTSSSGEKDETKPTPNWCGGASELILHSLWDCRIAQKVWKYTWNDTMHGMEGLKPDILVHRCREWQSELAHTQSTNKPNTVPLPLSLNPKATESLALWYGIEYGKKLGITNVDIRGDALNVLNGLKTRGWDFNEIRGVLDAVKLIMTEFEIVSWRCVKKRFNAVTHGLCH
ncbi:hypothetical protein ACLB2K_009118 [Fragaria x ananassa]